MHLKRVIPCLDVDAGRVVKGTSNSSTSATPATRSSWPRFYDRDGADELVFLDITATHEKRETIVELARRTADDVFVPFTIGGGIRSVADAQAVLDAGADKVSVNSAALARPELLDELARASARSASCSRSTPRRAPTDGWERARARRAHRAPSATPSRGRARASSAAPARSCSRAWTATARPRATTSR